MEKRYPHKSTHSFLAILISTLVFFAFSSVDGSDQFDRLKTGHSGFEQPLDTTMTESPMSGKELYVQACSNCHGMDGKGGSVKQLGLQTPPADFTDCNFANREPDGDWIAVAHQGGPVRGFSTEMPAFGEALSVGELQKIMDHVRTFCTNKNWPRGELNLPRALVTEKAYPEDEVVVSSFIDVENEGAVINEIVYEQRFGMRNQIEIVLPFGYSQMPGGGWNGGHLGDLAVGVKRVFYHNYNSGTIFSLTGEVIVPTGDSATAFGKGTTVLEPFASFGQLLPAGGFLHVQTGLEYPMLQDKAGNEAFWRAALGKSINPDPWGRTWSPMVEMLGSKELESGTRVHWDLVPQMQITLNKRQHVMLNVGYRIPVDDAGRDSQIMIYVLWDWFDGGFFEGW
ncbi:c-type cytochrome [Rhodohalobacter mucosus]|uniref:Cytochrome c, class I n=1 Tax=Rhodohalobacter mucosus TaxID=2079485 RepID=A0A316TLR8_9BACT|nr:cytochrome c [Rhodohalobacter mucosus]PWN05517.1 cytochrome c, class I [Rhodohalobacter mucosus]